MTGNQITERLLKASDVGKILNLSKRQVFRLRSSGRICKPVKIGGSIRWRESEIVLWIQAGCPDLMRWEIIRKKAAAEPAA